MSAEVHDVAACEVSESDARAELERLFSDTRFHATERQKAILSHLAERHFGGCDKSVKAYAIAVDVLGRGSGFDAASDPIVRIEMSRLRSTLSQYYEAFGSVSSVTIDIPKGRYVAVFAKPRHEDLEAVEIVKAGADTELGAEIEETSAFAAPDASSRLRTFRSPITAVLLALAVACAGVAVYANRPVYTERPTVSITMTAAAEDLQGDASLTRDMLLTALTQFQTIRVAGRDSARLRGAPRRGNNYDIDIKYYGDGNDRNVWWQIADTNSDNILQSGLEHYDASGRTSAAVRAQIAASLAQRLATTRGIINSIEIHDSADGLLGNACVVRAEYRLDVEAPEGLAASADCLERTLVAQPQNSDAASILARLLVDPRTTGKDTDPKVRALDLATRAAAIAPLSDRAQVALMMTQFYNGRPEAAIQSGNRALALNPNNPDSSADLALVLYFSGFHDAGLALAQDAARSAGSAPRNAQLVLALDAYGKEDWSSASMYAEQITGNDILVGGLRTASLAQLGSGEAGQALAEVRTRFPDFARIFPKEMAARRVPAELSSAIEDGLRRAIIPYRPDALASAH